MTNYPSPYRVDLFEELGKLCELDVTFEMMPSEIKHRNSAWYHTNYKNFTALQLKKTKIGSKYICFDIINIIKKNKYDAVVVGIYSSLTSIIAMRYMKKYRIPFFISSDGGFIKDNESWFRKKLKSHLIGMANYYLATGVRTEEYLKYYGGYDKKSFIYTFSTYKQSDLPSCFVSNEEKRQLRKELGISDKIVFLSVGQFIYRKGYDLLLKSCEGLQDLCDIYIVGAEPTEEYIKIKNDLNLNNVFFPGFKKKEDLIKYYKAVDVFILPTREDIWGLVINEAMTYGLPVITTQNCLAGVELISEKENGFIIPVDDIEEIKNKMIYFINNPEQCVVFGKKSFSKMQNYTIEQSAKDHFQAFCKIMKRGDKD